MILIFTSWAFLVRAYEIEKNMFLCFYVFMFLCKILNTLLHNDIKAYLCKFFGKVKTAVSASL